MFLVLSTKVVDINSNTPVLLLVLIAIMTGSVQGYYKRRVLNCGMYWYHCPYPKVR